MTLVKATIKTQDKIYVSVSISGHGKNDLIYDVAKTTSQLVPENFPSFNGTPEEFKVILNTAQSIKLENLGSE